MWHSVLFGSQNANRGEDCLRVTGVRDRNSTDFPGDQQQLTENINGNIGDSVGVIMAVKREVGGKGARALRALRERVKNNPNFPELTFAQMAFECGFLDEDGKGVASTYQYNEREFTKEYFSKDKVDRFKIPLVKRGIPEAEIYRVLMGVPNSSPARIIDVSSCSGTGRRVPVISRDAALRISRGELVLGPIAKLDSAAIQNLEAAGVIMGWESYRGVGDQTVIMEVLDGLGTEIVVDLSDKTLIEGKQYVLRHGDQMTFVTLENGMVIAEEGPHVNEALEFGKMVPVVFGRVVKTILNN